MGPGLFRFTLASVVVVTHVQRFDVGQAAVFLFFVLSGYWIARMWERKYARGRRPYAVFLASRFTRLLPTFLLMNAIAFFAHALLGETQSMTPRAWIANLVMLGYSSNQVGEYLTPAWSLDIELQFYLVAPLIFIALATRGSRFVGIACLAAALGGLVYFATHVEPRFAALFPYSAFFLIGIWSARTAWRPSRGVVLGALALTVLATLALMLSPIRGTLLGGHAQDPALYAFNPMACAGLALLAAPLAVATVHKHGGSWDRMAGDVSYVVYLVHWVPAWVIGHYTNHLPALERLPYVAAVLVFTYAGAFFLWRWFDRPLNQRREALVARALAPRAPASAPVATSDISVPLMSTAGAPLDRAAGD